MILPFPPHILHLYQKGLTSVTSDKTLNSHRNWTIGMLSDEHFWIIKIQICFCTSFVCIVYRSPSFKNNKPDIVIP